MGVIDLDELDPARKQMVKSLEEDGIERQAIEGVLKENLRAELTAMYDGNRDQLREAMIQRGLIEPENE